MQKRQKRKQKLINEEKYLITTTNSNTQYHKKIKNKT